MFNHISIGVRDIGRTKKFYDAALKPLGFKCLSEDSASLGYGDDAVALWIGQVAKPVSIDEKANLHFCFDAGTRKAVDAFHEGAMKTGGKDNGKPGLRADYSPTTRVNAFVRGGYFHEERDNGKHSTIDGTEEGNDIVQLGSDSRGLKTRWRFTEITANSFHWIGEESSSESDPWSITYEHFARRTDS